MNVRTLSDRTVFFKQRLVLLLFFTVSGCLSPQNNTPENLIEAETMSRVIADIKIIDAAYQAGIAPLGIDSLEEATPSDKAITDTKQRKKVKLKVLTELKDSIATAEVPTNDMIAYQPNTDIQEKVYRGHTGADYETVFRKHKVTREQFEISMEYYARNPDIFYPVIEKSLEILSQYEIEIADKKAENK